MIILGVFVLCVPCLPTHLINCSPFLHFRTARAMREYEVEIADIGDVSDVEEEYSEEEKEEDRNAVDHNLRRHLGVSGAEEGCGGYDDEYGNDFEDMFSTGQVISVDELREMPEKFPDLTLD